MDVIFLILYIAAALSFLVTAWYQKSLIALGLLAWVLVPLISFASKM